MVCSGVMVRSENCDRCDARPLTVYGELIAALAYFIYSETVYYDKVYEIFPVHRQSKIRVKHHQEIACFHLPGYL